MFGHIYSYVMHWWVYGLSVWYMHSLIPYIYFCTSLVTYINSTWHTSFITLTLVSCLNMDVNTAMTQRTRNICIKSYSAVHIQYTPSKHTSKCVTAPRYLFGRPSLGRHTGLYSEILILYGLTQDVVCRLQVNVMLLYICPCSKN